MLTKFFFPLKNFGNFSCVKNIKSDHVLFTGIPPLADLVIFLNFICDAEYKQRQLLE